MIISLRPCWGFVKGICRMSLFSKNMYPENSVREWIWKTTLNIHQLKNNKYKQSHICSNNQQMDLLDPWHIVSSILELSWPLIEILIWYPSSSWIILMVSPVWLSFLYPWTPFHLVHHHLASFIQFEILFGKYFLIFHCFLTKGVSSKPSVKHIIAPFFHFLR